ncbi:hypothetical protein [Pedobacter nototheniae]|uniref:hypothetical protein n=1 Tax=Pedobacter nototheniae TaxID=2488994 RepID=UPI0029309703|nr:hypothetical protein [Pedobacter nototheniae]
MKSTDSSFFEIPALLFITNPHTGEEPPLWVFHSGQVLLGWVGAAIFNRGLRREKAKGGTKLDAYFFST